MQNWIKTVVVAVSLALPGVVLAQSPSLSLKTL